MVDHPDADKVAVAAIAAAFDWVASKFTGAGLAKFEIAPVRLTEDKSIEVIKRNDFTPIEGRRFHKVTAVVIVQDRTTGADWVKTWASVELGLRKIIGVQEIGPSGDCHWHINRVDYLDSVESRLSGADALWQVEFEVESWQLEKGAVKIKVTGQKVIGSNNLSDATADGPEV